MGCCMLENIPHVGWAIHSNILKCIVENGTVVYIYFCRE